MAESDYKALRIIISGGGTGGHIFPAISIADKMKELNPESKILFVGAEGKMEMEKVPVAGYEIVGLPIVGLQRQITLRNIWNDLQVPFKVLQSVSQAKKTIRKFNPDIVIGVGGYASAPLLWAAQKLGVPTLIQEQNGFAGLTNKILGKKAGCICTAYENMERFFPAERIVLTGNPIRKDIVPADEKMRLEGAAFYNMNPDKKHIFITGGSLGSRTLNESMEKWIEAGCPGGEDVEVLWQCGKYYKKHVDEFMQGAEAKNPGIGKRICHSDFIKRMDLAYAMADVVISRSGASSVSELCAAHKCVVLVPSPNVAEDHQTHNAMALVNKGAAVLVKDAEAREKLLPAAISLLGDDAKRSAMEKNIAALAKTEAALEICREAYKLLNINITKNVYFIGIGGIGMSAIARYYNYKGWNVSGYDRTESELTDELVKEGIPVHYTDDISFIPKDVENTLVVYTPAIPHDMGELVYVQEHGYRVIKRSRMLGEIAEGQTCLAVAGTHGKTTTSTLTAHILTQSGEGCSAFLGGISKNYGTNLLVSHNPVVVAEADEFDRSFLQLHPAIAVITAMDADHLDIYGDLAHVQEAFRQFASQVTNTLIIKKGLPVTSADTKATIKTYSYNDTGADYHAENVHQDELGYFIYDLKYPEGIIKDIKVGAPGWVNVENSVAAAAICLNHGTAEEGIRKAIGSFTGAKRRLDLHIHTGKLSYIDDYAHHPAELATAISSMREIFPGRKLTAVFQPHLYTRTRDFAPEFAEALSKVDKLILLDIYPAREEPIPGVTSEIIFDKVNAPEKVLLRKEELMDYLKDEPIEVLATFGAGNIDRFIGPITEMLEKRLG